MSFGAAVGPGPHLYADAAKHELKLFAVVVGRTSRARKGTSRVNVQRVFNLAAPDWSAENVVSGMSSGEGLVTALATEGDLRGVLVVESEFGVAFSPWRAAETTRCPTISASSGMGTKSESSTRSGWTSTTPLSVIGHITADELEAKMPAVDWTSGFANRILWVHAERSKLRPDGTGMPAHRLGELADSVEHAIARAKKITRMRRSKPAEGLWATYYEEMARTGSPGRLGAVTSRAEAQALRLSMVYAALDGATVISPKHVEAGYTFWRYCEESAAYVLDDSTGDTIADRIIKALQEAPDGALSRTTIQTQVLGNNTKKDRLDAALDLLKRRDRIRERKVKTRGRPAQHIILVP